MGCARVGDGGEWLVNEWWGEVEVMGERGKIPSLV
jgi:hypothetical protein